ncbi:HNH endonuclease [Hoeflea sp. YIM 152468]|uniref:HNH endonuclease n=1 Tax=Hoeflea sp. YIM 152468 TaxID=3031759 RepID=UPI0023DA85A6|nr:HNH endonuclease [Hoeflea sp. YIM 152468]MDF1607581.1 HNH endonuclease [Hoeflea sp. YIM 152468]
MKTCIYCGREKKEFEFDRPEHIWPQAIGVSNSPKIFVTNDVCGYCNNKCGLHVDGAFLKGYFSHQERSRHHHAFLNPDKPAAFPLFYLGVETDFPCQDDEQCDRYAGAAGEHIRHVRRKTDEDWWAYVGGDPKRQSRRGRIYVNLTADHPYWVITAALSVRKIFPKCHRVCLTDIVGDMDFTPFWESRDGVVAQSHPNEVRHILDEVGTVSLRAAIQVDFTSRFLCKVALGLGCQILGINFLESEAAKRFREVLWKKDYTERSKSSIRGTGFSLGVNGNFAKVAAVDDCWTLLINVVNGCLSLTIFHPSGNFSSLPISDDPELISKADQSFINGAVFVVCPALNFFSDAIPSTKFLLWKQGFLQLPELDRVVSLRISLDDLPPKMAKDDPALTLELGNT